MYEHVKDSYMSRGMSEDKAQGIAAATYIKRGKGGSRSSRAKALHSDSRPSKEAMKHVVSSYSAKVKKKGKK
jgi:VIT1/CCC1 family predicted Fe2+/Mn2+ transporter